MTIYLLVRDEDVSGMSGIGVVAEILESSLGPCHLHWRREPYGETRYASIEDLIAIHGHGGRTYLVEVMRISDKLLELALGAAALERADEAAA